MKNLLIYYNPDGQFEKEYEDLTRIQIDNSLDLGWKVEDMVLVTNFPYEYHGVKATVIGQGDYAVWDHNKSSKIPIINRLFADGLIQYEVYWFHDVDAFQLVPLELKLEKEAAFTTHGAWSKEWNAGSFFFKLSARDIFEAIWHYMQELGDTNEQPALTYMWENNIDDINSRYELLDSSYNIGIYKIAENVAASSKPLKVLHFHPHKPRHLELYRDILPERLMKIFNQYGIHQK